MFDRLRSIRWLFPGREESSTASQERPPLAASLVAEEKAEPAMTKRQPSPAAKIYAQKRRHPRYPVEGRDVRAHMLFSEEVVVQNLSVSGACIRTIRDLQVGFRYLLRLQDRQPALLLHSTVIWKRPEEDKQDMFQGFLAGLQFLRPDFEDIIRLKDFMRLNGYPDEKTADEIYTPSALRFHIRSEQKAVLNCPQVLDVKKISLGGMLIGSSVPFEPEGRYAMNLLLSRGADPVKIKGRIASVIAHSENGPATYEIGVEFLDMEAPAKARVERFIRNL